MTLRCIRLYIFSRVSQYHCFWPHNTTSAGYHWQSRAPVSLCSDNHPKWWFVSLIPTLLNWSLLSINLPLPPYINNDNYPHWWALLLTSYRMDLDLILTVGIKSTADQSAQSTLISAFEALAEKCVNEKTGKPLITSFKCGKQNSPEGMTKGLEMIFVLEFEVCLFLSSWPGKVSRQWANPLHQADQENIEDRDYYLDHPAHVEFKVSHPSLSFSLRSPSWSSLCLSSAPLVV